MKIGIRELLFLCVMGGLLASSYFSIFKTKQAERLALIDDTARMKRELVQLEQTTAGIEDLGREIDDLERAIDFFESKLPQEKEVDKILKEVWQMAEANSLQTKTVKTLKTERAAGYSEQPIQMNLKGNFYGFYAFLLKLESLPRITRVTHMNLQNINDTDGEMEAQLTLSIFFEPAGGGGNSGTGSVASAN